VTPRGQGRQDRQGRHTPKLAPLAPPQSRRVTGSNPIDPPYHHPTGYANIQCMYAPEFNSHSENINLEVKGRQKPTQSFGWASHFAGFSTICRRSITAAPGLVFGFTDSV
jgi:hypothetical protein